MVMSFDAQEMQLMHANKLSSVFREVKNVRLAVEKVVFELGSVNVAGKVIVYTGDCLPAIPAIQDLLKMKGSVDVFPEVKQLFRFAAVHDVELDFIWLPREADAMLYADMVFRVEDSSEIFLSHQAFKHVCLQRTQGGIWGWPTLDVFAGGAPGQHVVSRYYTLYCTPHALAANAMYQSWQHDACVPSRASMLWVFHLQF